MKKTSLKSHQTPTTHNATLLLIKHPKWRFFGGINPHSAVHNSLKMKKDKWIITSNGFGIFSSFLHLLNIGCIIWTNFKIFWILVPCGVVERWREKNNFSHINSSSYEVESSCGTEYCFHSAVFPWEL